MTDVKYEPSDLDRLLDAFQNDKLSEGDIHRLAEMLTAIIGAEPGEIKGGRQVMVGDKIAAAIVLRVLDQLGKTISSMKGSYA